MLRRNASKRVAMLSNRVLFQTDQLQSQERELLCVRPFVDDQFPLNEDQNLQPCVQDEPTLHLPNLHENARAVLTFRHLCDVHQCAL